MIRYLLLLAVTLMLSSVQWLASIDNIALHEVMHGLRPEFLPDEVELKTKDPLFSIPLDLQKKIRNDGTTVLVDFRLPSDQKRLWVVRNNKVLVHCRVAHGKNSGELITEHFSNETETNMSCLGEFKTGRIYDGEKGLAMRVHGSVSYRHLTLPTKRIV